MDKRFFLALFLSLIVIFVSQMLFPTVPPVKPTATGTDSTRVDTLVASPTAPSTPAVVDRSPASPADSVVAPTQAVAESATVTTPKALYTFSNTGAAPVSIVIRDYQNRSPTGGLVDLALPGLPLLEFRIAAGADTVDLRRMPFSLARSVDSQRETLTYTASVENRQVAITYAIPLDTAASYSLQVSGRVVGGEGQAYMLIDLPSSLRSVEQDTVADQQSLAYSYKPLRDHAGSVLFGDIDPGEKRLQPGPLSWIAVKSKYFVLGILPPSTGVPFSEVTLTGGPRTSKVATNATATAVIPVSNSSFVFDVYAGPQESQRLFRMGREFDHVNPYGWGFVQGVVHPIASEVIRGLLWMHNRLNLSYGWVLIILGVLIRLALWPLNQSTMRSSLKMQEIQPKLQAAQKKYKDPLQQREAIMKVYKEAGVSPFAGLTGCLPALLPMPILFALFFVFQNTIEFRGVPFMWLHDISVKDPYYILPLLMGGSMYVLSWIGMRNAPPNPQAKMMMYMFPVMMTVVLLNMASGLNLYYTAQNIAALPQQWLLARERSRARALGS
ncbi:MAG: membrane protein insertase YidC [Gemmatimonadota bacterium]|nr:membrane protein insertase YidC [Gemmatimonadota bacterium]